MSNPVNPNATRRIPLEFDAKGNPIYHSVLSPVSFKPRALCIAPPIHVIPIIFVPGIMGSNLRSKADKTPAWRPPNGKRKGIGEVFVRAGQNPKERQTQLNPIGTEVDPNGTIVIPSDHYTITNDGARIRGWGEVHWEGYGQIMLELERALNDQYENPGTKRATQMPIWKLAQDIKDETRKHWNPKPENACPDLTAAEFLRMDDYFYPVWACGYNWMQSNEDSAKTLQKRIDEVLAWYEKSGYFVPEGRVIIVTHSMGGLVARRTAQLAKKKGKDQILGIVHGVQPVMGAPVVYRRFRAGTESDGFFDVEGKLAAIVLGWDAADTTCVLAHSPGALELLPTKDYKPGWLKIQIKIQSGEKTLEALPKGQFVNGVQMPPDPYSEIYGKRVQDVWWGMVDETLIDPAGLVKDKPPFKAFTDALEDAKTFHGNLGLYVHPNTYAHYGADADQQTYHSVRWRTAVANYDSNLPAISSSQTGDLMKTPGTKWDLLGDDTRVKLKDELIRFELLGKDGAGDATVPEPSGAKVAEMGLKLTFKMKGFEHAKSYNNRHVLDNTAYCIGRILLALAALGCAANGYADGGIAMNDTQTYCFGRFLIDLPKTAELQSQTSGFMFGEIETGRTPPKQNIHQDGFVEMMKVREADLRAGKHEKNYSFSDVRNVSTVPKGRVFKIHRKMTVVKETNYGFEAYLSNGGVLFSMKETAYDEDKIDSVLQRLETRLLPNLRARRPDEIPSEPGFCIKEGFIADDGQTPQYEYARLSFRFKEWPDVTLKVHATRGGKIQPSLLERVKNRKIPALFADVAKEVKTLRQGKHDVGPLKGEEDLLALPTDDGYFTHHFVWDTQGKLDSATEPAFYFELHTGFIVGSNNPDVRPTLTDKQAIKLFDSIVNSIRLRPTTPGKSSDAGGPDSPGPAAPKRLPLKSKVTSASNCPQTGMWECAPGTPGISGHRRFFVAGQGMPFSLAQRPARGLGRFIGMQEDDAVEITWTLVAYEKDAS